VADDDLLAPSERRALLDEISGVTAVPPPPEVMPEPEPPPLPVIIAIPPRPRPKPRSTRGDELAAIALAFSGLVWFAAGCASASASAALAGALFAGLATAVAALRVRGKR
jgi:hypothetical protein